LILEGSSKPGSSTKILSLPLFKIFGSLVPTSSTRRLTISNAKSIDEFLIQKKDPLILPPDFESLPTPSDRDEATEELSSFEKTLKKASETEITSSSSGSSAEDSILKQIRKK